MKDNTPPHPSRVPIHLESNVNIQNSEIISILGEHLSHLSLTMIKSGDFETHQGFNKFVAKSCGCNHVTIYQIRRGKLKYCGISLLTKICASLGLNFVELIRSPMPTARIKGELDIFGSVKDIKRT